MGETLTIAPKIYGKGRRFRAQLLGLVTADAYHSQGSNRVYRPVYLSIAESDAQVRAVVANLRTGRLADLRDAAGQQLPKQLETPRGMGLRWSFRKMERPAGVTVATGYLPSLFDLDPGILQDDIRFLFAPPRWWVDEQAEKLLAIADTATLARYAGGGGAREQACATLFAAFLDRRSPLPIVPDPLFHLRLYRAARMESWCYAPDGNVHSAPRMLHYSTGKADGMEAVYGVKVSHDAFEALLIRETARYFDEEEAPWVDAVEPVEEPIGAEIAAEDVPLEEPEPEAFKIESVLERVPNVEPVCPVPVPVSAGQVSLFDL